MNKTLVRILITTAALATIPAAAMIGRVHMDVKRELGATAKDQSRLPVSSHAPDVVSENEGGRTIIVSRDRPPEETFGPPGLPGNLPPFPFFPPLPGVPDAGAFPPRSPRVFCEEQVNRIGAAAGYLRSKLRLTGPQQEAWRRIEEASQPALDRQRQICAELPSEAGAPPNFQDIARFLEQQLDVSLELLRALREPFRSLYETLTPSQRAVLDSPLFPPHRGRNCRSP